MPSSIIHQVRLTHVRVPLIEPFVISNGVVADKDAIIVELLADNAVGLGEASPMAGAFYSHHTPESSWQTLTNGLIPAMNDAKTVDLAGRWFAHITDDPFATCGIDTALWDLAGHVTGAPLWSLIGGDGRRDITSGLAVGIFDLIETLLERIHHFRSAHGYRRVKIKVQPGWDVEPLHAIRDRFGDIPLMVDANCAYCRDDIDAIADWDRLELMMIEQPLPRDDFEGHAELAGRCRTPICLDESAETAAAVERAISLSSASIINIKLQRIGSLAAARRVHDIASAANTACWMGTMPELGIGAYAAMHFATLPGIVYPSDVEASSRWFIADITDPPVTCRDGLLSLPDAPGLGVNLDHATIERFLMRQTTIPVNVSLAF